MHINILKILYLVSFITVFFPMCVIYIIPNSNANIQLCTILVCLLFCSILVAKFKLFICFLNELLHNKIYRLYIVTVLVITFLAILNLLLGKYNAPFFFYFFRIMRVYFTMILIYLLPVLSLFLNVNFKKIVKLTIALFLLILAIGICQFLFNLFGLDVINDLIKYSLANWRLIRGDESDGAGFRSSSIFDEASRFGNFIVIILPIIFNITHSPYKIVNNIVINKLLKKLFIAIAFIALICTKSPIYLIMFVVEYASLTILYNRKLIKRYSCQWILLGICTFFTIKFYLNSLLTLFNLGYLKRILAFISSVSNLNLLILKEGSLATRIISAMYSFQIFSKNIFIGTGLCNSEVFANKLFYKTGLPYTEELVKKYNNVQGAYALPLNKTLFWTSLAEFGLIGFLILIYFCAKNIILGYSCLKYFNSTLSIFLKGILQSLVVLLLLAFYSNYVDNFVLWLLLGFILAYIHILKSQKLRSIYCIKY